MISPDELDLGCPSSMEAPDNRLSEFVDFVKSWIHQRPKPENVSRNFWMPDHSCRVCYECDSQFTLLNRRHHCRLCGRVFCGKCTINSVSAPSDSFGNEKDEGERIRVCNYCYKQWEQHVAAVHGGNQLSVPGLSPSLSSSSLISVKSNGTADGTNSSAGSTSYTTETFQQMGHNPRRSCYQTVNLESHAGRVEMLTEERNMESTTYMGDPSSTSHLGTCMNSYRSDDEDYEFHVCHSDSEVQQCHQCVDYYSPAGTHGVEHVYISCSIQADEESNDKHDLSFLPKNKSDCEASLGVDKLADGADGPYELDTSSSIYKMEAADVDPVDFENNRLLWFPPDPDGEEDEREVALFDDDDDGGDDGDDGALGDWSDLHSINSFDSGDSQCRDRASEEHRKAMKHVVDGHFRALVSQLLQIQNLSLDEESDKESWLEIITSLSWEAANFLKPDTSHGDGMDPVEYLKIKCIACGRRSESTVIKGIVCKKNVAHRRMTTRIEKPRLLILGGALEYQRKANSLSSVDTLLQQETDHLKMAVTKIDAQHPNVLLVEKSVSRFAQDYLLAKGISLVLNMKRPLLERIARCTGAKVVASVDNLSPQVLGYCDSFHVEKVFEEHGSASQDGKKLLKTLMFFEDCPKPLGCTVLLKGVNCDELKKVKHVIRYGIFAAYHLTLETSFLADEGASLPEFPLESPIVVALPGKLLKMQKSICMVPVKLNTYDDKFICSKSPPEKVSEIEHAHGTKNKKVAFGGHPEIGRLKMNGRVKLASCHKFLQSLERTVLTENRFTNESESLDSSWSQAFQQDDDHLDDGILLKEDFLPSPSNNQSILVSSSTRCIWKGIVCENPHLIRIKYYGSCDKPLGRFLRDSLFDQGYQCHSCEMPSEAHVRCYTHCHGSLTISVKRFDDYALSGEQDGKIWMWHRCLRCPRINNIPQATKRVVLSDAAWGLSFGKFLELSFSNHAATSRVASCGHSLHRDCLRFYGLGKMVACFGYAPINVRSVYLPPSKLDFKYENQVWIQKEADEVASQAELLFSEVLNALRQVAEKKLNLVSTNSDVRLLESRYCITEFEGNLQKEKTQFEESLKEVMKNTTKGHLNIDILDINKLRRQLLIQSYVWDKRLVAAASLDSYSHQGSNRLNREIQDKIDYIEKLAEVREMPRTQRSVTNCSQVDTKAEEPSIKNMHVISNTKGNHILSCPDDLTELNGGENNLNVNNRKPDETCLCGSSMNGNHELDLYAITVLNCRSLSDSKSPVMQAPSNSSDGNWTAENRPTASEVMMSDSSAMYETATGASESEGHSDGIDAAFMPHSLNMSSTTKEASIYKGTEWITMPFMSLYQSFNGDNMSSTQRLHAFSEYSPAYLSSFLEFEHQSGARLLLSTGINDTVIPVYDDEPTSIIAYALMSPEYHSQMVDEYDQIRDSGELPNSLSLSDPGNLNSCQSLDEISSEYFQSIGSFDENSLSVSRSQSSPVLALLLYTKALKIRVSFSDESPTGKAKYTVTCYYAKKFDALRKICCPSELDYVRSLSRCKKWKAQGGKSNAFFAKSLDDRFIIKQVTRTELESFIQFAPEYFKYVSESISTRSPTCLAKILGMYQVTSKQLNSGKESKMDVLVMENLMFGRNVKRLYDLKGSLRSRYNADSSGNNIVLLDQNLVESLPTSPIFVGNKAKRLLERAVWNDTSFLASIDVMDYSLLMGVDEENNELVMGIIDFLRQYTWDKHLETWVKASGLLGGPKNASPTVISPKQYKKRFRKAMSTYFLMVSDGWSPATINLGSSQSSLQEDCPQVLPQDS